jgi:type VII secretion effector (TIGR04197 family)
MSVVGVNPMAAQQQATKICQASDQLTIGQTVTFSTDTTIAGNQTAESTFQTLAKSAGLTQQMVVRDVQAIQSVIQTFTRTDEQIKKQIETASIQPALGGGMQ